jgi:hypothetical protein
MSDTIFHRTPLAERLAAQVLHVSPTSASSSGLFLAAPRRTGKTTFVRGDLAPALLKLGATVIYTDLWIDRQADPGEVIVNAIRAELGKHEAPLAKLAKNMGLSGAKIGGLDFSLDRIGLGRDISLVQALAALSDDVRAPIVLLIDEAQHAITSQAGADAMFALKAARDELNTSHQGLRVVCTGSNRDKLAMLRSNKDQAFFGAPLIDFPALGRDYVEWFCANCELPAPLESAFVWPLFQAGGSRPEILGAAADQIRFDFTLSPEKVSQRFEEVVLEQICQTNAQQLAAFHSLTDVQQVVLRVLAAAGAQYAPFEQATFERYAQALPAGVAKIEFSVSNVQPALQSLQDKGLVWKASRGIYAIEDATLADLLREKGYLEGLAQA